MAAESTTLVKDILEGAGGSKPEQLARLGDTLLFTAYTKKHGHELWRSNGTARSTRLVKDINRGADGSDARAFASLDGKLFFQAYSRAHPADASRQAKVAADDPSARAIASWAG